LLTGCRFPGTVKPTIKIGLVAPFEGRYRYVGYDVIYAVRLALREANAAGGVAGYSVELVAYDDGGESAMAAEQAHKLSIDPAVVAAIGHFREETTVGTLGIYAKADIPLVAPAVFDPLLTQGKGVFRLGPMAGTMETELYRQEPLVVTSLQSTDGLRDVTASTADTVLFDADPVTAGEIAAALYDAGWEGTFLGGPELAAADYAAVAGGAAEGTVFVTPYPFPKDVPGSADFIAAYQAVSHGVPPGPLALPAYEATWVLLEALERDIAAHGEPTREGMTSALAPTRREGLLGEITFDGDRNWSDAPLYWYQIGAEGTAQLWVD
jgi:ABC-type branched-subunit amino acid transport system substrate-binding protein